MMDQLSPPWRLKAHLLKIYKMHILTVRLVRSYWSRIEVVKRELNFDNCFAVNRYGRGDGLTIFWRTSCLVSMIGYSPNHIDLEDTEVGGFKWRPNSTGI